MVRSNEYKLILSQDETHCRFFDLTKDPYEFINHYENPSYKQEITSLKNALIEMILFKEPSPNYLNESAPDLEKSSQHKNERESLKTWIQSKM